MISIIIDKLYKHEFKRTNVYCLNSLNYKNDILEYLNVPSNIEILQDNSIPIIQYNLEEYMLALPKKYLIMYVSCAMMNIFHPNRNMTFVYDYRTHFSYDDIYIIKLMKKTLCNFETDIYHINVLDTYLPWNDYILTYLATELYKKDIFIEKNIFTKENDMFEEDEIKQIVTKLINKDEDFIKSLQNDEFYDHFINKTQDVAVSINGTACVGKTNLLRELKEEITKRYDSSCSIEKIGIYGAYKGKDNNQILALSYQGVCINIANRFPSSLLDRDPFNNLIWRCILQFVNTTDDNEELINKIVHMFTQSISKNLILTMQQYPVIVLIDLNERDNRERMFNRATGGDRKRCYITNYVCMQNLFYCLFSYFCKWPVFNTAFNANNRAIIKHLVFSKVKNNSRNPKTNTPYLNSMVTFKSEHIENFDGAIKMRIMK